MSIEGLQRCAWSALHAALTPEIIELGPDHRDHDDGEHPTGRGPSIEPGSRVDGTEADGEV